MQTLLESFPFLERFFELLMIRALVRNPIRLYSRVFKMTCVSMLDLATDVVVLFDYFEQEATVYYGYSLTAMVLCSLILQAIIVVAQHRKKPGRIPFELLLVCCGMKPGLDAYVHERSEWRQASEHQATRAVHLLTRALFPSNLLSLTLASIKRRELFIYSHEHCSPFNLLSRASTRRSHCEFTRREPRFPREPFIYASERGPNPRSRSPLVPSRAVHILTRACSPQINPRSRSPLIYSPSPCSPPIHPRSRSPLIYSPSPCSPPIHPRSRSLRSQVQHVHRQGAGGTRDD